MEIELLNEAFSSLSGHQVQREHLLRLLEKDAVPHAMLFCGPSGVGKRTLALEFAALLLSKNLQSSMSLAKQSSISRDEVLKLVRSGTHPDLHIVSRDPSKKDITVDTIRNLRSALQLKPYYGNGSVAVIDNAHEMNIAASNALLMTLEEPPGESFLILVTDSPQRLPETIISRCQLLHFGELSKDDISRILEQRFSQAIGDSSLLNSLIQLAGSTLTALGIAPFIDPRTSLFKDEKALCIHLRELVGKSNILDRQLDRLFSEQGKNKDLASYATCLATHLAQEKDSTSLTWHMLRTKIRHRLRHSDKESNKFWANLLLASMESERLIRERNLNTQLQLSSLLLRAAV